MFVRLLVQVVESLYRLLRDDPTWENPAGGRGNLNDANEAEDDEDAADVAADAARRERLAALRRLHRMRERVLQRAAATPASNLFHLGQLNRAASGAAPPLASPASVQLASALLPAVVTRDVLSANPSGASSLTSSLDFSSTCVVCLGEFAPTASPTSPKPPDASAATAATAAAVSSPSEVKSSRVFLPCAHSFHESCIQQWFRSCVERRQPKCCPTCRNVSTSIR